MSWGCKRVRVWHFRGWGPRAWARAWSKLCPLGFGAGSECGLGYVGHVEQVYLRRQGPNRLSWGSKRVRVWHRDVRGWGPRAWARAWSRLWPLGFGAGSECGLGYVGHVEQVYLRRQGPNRLSWGCKRVRVRHFRGWGPRAWARAWSGLCPLGFGAGSECGLGYVGHVEQVYLRRQGPNRLSWGCKRVRVWHFRGVGA